MTSPSALQPAELDPARKRLADLESEVSGREAALATIKSDLHALQSRYLREVGPLYVRLTEVEAELAEAEIAAGLRPPSLELDDDADRSPGASDADTASCTNRAAPSDGLKKIFRDLAKSIHPDLAMDEPARWRRHSLMAEANRAYAERDEDRLRLIMRAWERSPEWTPDADPEADRARVARRIALLDEHLIAIEADLADLRASAIWRLKQKIDGAKAQGWDLFAEMILQVKRDISRAQARLNHVKRL
jgi:hypothetical protein